MMHPNRLKWLAPPTIEQIEAVYKHKLKIPGAAFERWYKMPRGMIAKVRLGSKPMPAKYWHLFFEEPTVEEAGPVAPSPKKQKRTIESLSHIM